MGGAGDSREMEEEEEEGKKEVEEGKQKEV